jgi:hypothetical protein
MRTFELNDTLWRAESEEELSLFFMDLASRQEGRQRELLLGESWRHLATAQAARNCFNFLSGN